MHKQAQQQARDMYFSGNHSQRDIANTVGVSEKTVYLWIKQEAWDQLRQAALAAPAVIVDNLYSQLAELQQSIASREEGNRYPTVQEAEITRKLINCIIKLKEYPSQGANMQMMMQFAGYLQKAAPQLQKEVVIQADAFLKGRGKIGYKPYQIEYDVTPENQSAITEELPESNFSGESEIFEPTQAETLATQASQPPPAASPVLPQSEKTGNSFTEQTPTPLTDTIYWVGHNLVFDTSLNKVREIKMGELYQLRSQGLPVFSMAHQ